MINQLQTPAKKLHEIAAAKKWDGFGVHPDGSIACSWPFFAWDGKPKDICLDGNFTAASLRAIVDYVESVTNAV